MAPTPRFEPPAHFTTTSRTGHSVFIVGLKAENDYIKKMSKVILFSYEESAKEVQSYQNMLEKKHKECKGVEICEVYEQVAFFPTKGILSPQRFKERLENPQYILELYNNPSDAIRQVKGKGGLIMLKVLIGRCGEGNAKLRRRTLFEIYSVRILKSGLCLNLKSGLCLNPEIRTLFES